MDVDVRTDVDGDVAKENSRDGERGVMESEAGDGHSERDTHTHDRAATLVGGEVGKIGVEEGPLGCVWNDRQNGQPPSSS